MARAVPTEEDLNVENHYNNNISDIKPSLINKSKIELYKTETFHPNKLPPRGVIFFKRLTSNKQAKKYISNLPYLIMVKGIVVSPFVKICIDMINGLEGLKEIYQFIFQIELETKLGKPGWGDPDNISNLASLSNRVHRKHSFLETHILKSNLFDDMDIFKSIYEELFAHAEILTENYEFDFSDSGLSTARAYRIFKYLNDTVYVNKQIDARGDFINIDVKENILIDVIDLFPTYIFVVDENTTDGLKSIRNLERSSKEYIEKFSIVFDVVYDFLSNILVHNLYYLVLDMLNLVFFLARVKFSEEELADDRSEKTAMKILEKLEMNKFLNKYRYNVYDVNYVIPEYLRQNKRYRQDLSELLSTIIILNPGFLDTVIEHISMNIT